MLELLNYSAVPSHPLILTTTFSLKFVLFLLAIAGDSLGIEFRPLKLTYLLIPLITKDFSF